MFELNSFTLSVPKDCSNAIKPGHPPESNAISFAAMDPATIPVAEKPSAAITAGVRTTAATPPANQTTKRADFIFKSYFK